MNKTLAITTIALVAGIMMIGSITPAAFASGQGNGSDSDKGKENHGQKGCETAKEASQGKTKNPHCKFDLCEILPTVGSGEAIQWVRDNDTEGNPTFMTLAEWTAVGGSEELFDEVDRNNNGRVQPVEIFRWHNMNC